MHRDKDSISPPNPQVIMAYHLHEEIIEEKAEDEEIIEELKEEEAKIVALSKEEAITDIFKP